MARKETATVDLKLRLKEPLRAQIEAAASARGVSLNAEMVSRLYRSFESEEDVFGGRHIYAFMKLLASAVSFIESQRDRKWHEDAATYREVAATLPKLLASFEPKAKKGDNGRQGVVLEEYTNAVATIVRTRSGAGEQLTMHPDLARAKREGELSTILSEADPWRAFAGALHQEDSPLTAEEEAQLEDLLRRRFGARFPGGGVRPSTKKETKPKATRRSPSKPKGRAVDV